MNIFTFTYFRITTLILSVGALVGCVGRVPSTVQAHRNIVYGVADGYSMKLDLYTPKKTTRKLPVLIWLYGGGWMMGDKSPCPIAFMAGKRDIAIVSVNYRLDNVATFPAQIYDCKGAVRWLRANADRYSLDADHIGVFGVSAGGHLALLLATTAGNPKLEGDVGGNLDYTSRVQCACAWYPPTDLNHLVTDPMSRRNPKNMVARLLGGPVADNIAKADFASPITYVSTNCAPVFLMHGGADTLVPPSQSESFYNALTNAGVEARLEIIPNKGHGIIAPQPVADEMDKFFQAHLGGD